MKISTIKSLPAQTSLNYSLAGTGLQTGEPRCAPKPVRDDTDDTSRARLMIANTFPPSFIKLRHFNLILCKLGSSFQVIHINDNWETVRINCNYNSIRRFDCIYQKPGPEDERGISDGRSLLSAGSESIVMEVSRPQPSL